MTRISLFILLSSLGLTLIVSGQNPKSKAVVKSSLSAKRIARPDTASKPVAKAPVYINKEKHLQNLCNQLSSLLAEKKFSAFAMHMRKALNQFPQNEKLLALKKQFVIEDYKSNVLGNKTYRVEKYFEKKPSISTSQPGLVNAAGNQLVLDRLNYVRRLAGLYDSCVFDPVLNRKSQLTSLMMEANNTLDHFPKPNWKCYTKEGALAAGSSNLSLGYAFADALMGQMEERGSINAAVGHRRWILNPYNNVFGHGSTYNSMTLYVFGSSDATLVKKTGFNDSQFVAWPAADFFPLDLVPERWSFSLEDADFSKAKITVMADGKPVKVRIEHLKTGYSLNTIVWKMDDNVRAGVTYTVNISQVKLVSRWGSLTFTGMKNYTYKVTPLAI